MKEVAFISWPEKKRGLMTPLWERANVKGAMAVVPADVSTFGVGGVDLAALYKGIMNFMDESFPFVAAPVKKNVEQIENMLGIGVPALLKALGKDFVSYSIVRPGNPPITVFLISVRNSELIRRTVAQIEKKMGRKLLVESVDAVPIFTVPAPSAQFYFSICEEYLAMSQDVDALRDFVRNRKGRRVPLAGRPDVKDILNRRDLAGLSYVNLGQQVSYMAQMISLMNMAGPKDITKSLPTDRVSDVLRDLSADLGSMWALFFTDRDGISYEIQSNCGLVPFGVSAGAVAGAVAVPAVIKARERERENAIVQAIRSVAAAQEIFRARNGRYAQNLWELKRALVIDSELGRGYKNGYLFKLRSTGADNWFFDVRPVGGRGKFFYCDHTGIIRAERDRPARSESPVATGIAQ